MELNCYENQIFKKYISDINELYFIRNLPIDSSKKRYVENILCFLVTSQRPQNLKHLTFSKLCQKAQFNKDCENVDDVKLAIAILTDERIDALKELFEVHDKQRDESIVLNFEEIMPFISEHEYINPITELKISKEEFSEIITTFFSISEKLIGDLSA